MSIKTLSFLSWLNFSLGIYIGYTYFALEAKNVFGILGMITAALGFILARLLIMAKRANEQRGDTC